MGLKNSSFKIILSIIILLVIFAFFFNTGSKKGNNNCSTENEFLEEGLVFQSGFEGGSVGSPNNAHEKITGIDTSFPSHNNWKKSFSEHPLFGNFNIWYEEGDASQRYARIIDDPFNSNNKVLHFWMNEPHINYDVIKKKGRIQASIVNNNNLRSFYMKQRVFLSDDFEQLESYPKKINWLTLQEFWNDATSKKFPFRVTLNLRKTVSGNGNLYFGTHAQTKEKGKWNNIWDSINKEYAVPNNQWITIETYLVEGNETEGRFVFKVTDESGNKKTIFDITGYTYHPNDPCPDGFNRFNPMKLYTSDDLIDYMSENDKTLQMYWDDFEIWANKKPL